MRWPRRRHLEAPEDVQLRFDDGTVIRCGVIRDPDRDYGKTVVWVAVPLEPFPDTARSGVLEIGMLPARSAVDLYVKRDER